MAIKSLTGKRYLALLRCSTTGQADTSIDDQRRVLDAFAREHGLIAAGEVVLPGVSGSLPGARDDIPRIIERKKSADDFEVLLVQDTSRLSRAGIKHVHHLEWELESAGIQVIYASGNQADGWVGDLETSFNAGVAQAHAKAIAFGSARGSMSSILDGRSPYCRKPPYGIDRLYVDEDGAAIHVIRNLSDGRQLQLHPETGDLIREFKPNEKTGVPNHYIKQKQERIVLIPGAPERVETVRRIYRLRHVDNLGSFRIAKALNEDGIESPSGKKWTTTTVLSILNNPVYTGLGIANRYTSAVYNMRSPDRPVETHVPTQELMNRKRPARQTRPREDWQLQTHPELAELLEPEVREAASAKQQTHLDGQAGGHLPKPDRDKHRGSSFFLKGLLHSKQGNQPMTGITTGNKGSKRRYYRVNRAYSAPDGNKVMRKMVPADPLEQAILEVVRHTLLHLLDLRTLIEGSVRTELEATARDHAELESLHAEKEDIRRKLKLIVGQFDGDMQELIQEEIVTLKARLRTLNERITRCEATRPTDTAAVQEIVEQTITAIHEIADTMKSAPPATLRQLLSSLIGKLVVDLETRAVDLEIRLPIGVGGNEIAMCLVKGSACKCCNETHPENSDSMMRIKLMWTRHYGYGAFDFGEAA